jgi:hypothetical protein
MIKNLILGTLLLAGATQGWGQTTDVGVSAAAADQPMTAPPPVNAGGESVAFTSEMEKSNYVRGGLSMQGAYSDNIFSSTPAEGDATYTISPDIGLDITRSRLRWSLSYSPGFTFYQRFSAENQVDHVFSTSLQYRLSPHVTLSLQDNLSKTPSFSGLIQPQSSAGAVAQSPGFLVVGQDINTFVNTGSGELTYQFAPNTMAGFGGGSYELRYLGDAQTQGVFDSSESNAKAFYTHRFSGAHYVGVNYGFQDMVTHPIGIETQVQSATLFYSFYVAQKVSFSLFGGAQYADTHGGGFPSSHSSTPTEGVEVNFQGVHNSLASNFSRTITTGGGLQSAVHAYVVDANLRHQFTPHFSAAIQLSYSNNDLLQPGSFITQTNGHTFTGGGSLQHGLGQHFSAEMGYTRTQQDYSYVAIASQSPTADRGWIAISYQFQRPLGR